MNGAHPQKIVIITSVLWRGGGAEKVAAMLGNELLARGHDVHLLTFYEAAEQYPYHGTYHTFAEPQRSRLSKLWGIPARIYRIGRFLRKHKFDAGYTFLEEANFYTLIAARLFRLSLPVVVSVRNNTRSRSRLVQYLMRRLYPRAQAVVCVTRGVEEMLAEDHALTNLTTIYNPIDTDETAARAAEPLPEADRETMAHTPLCMHIGRHTYQKGQWGLLRAFAHVRTERPEAQLVMIGDGPDTAKITALRDALGLTDAVSILGKRSNVLPYLAAADVAVSSSLWEGMPNTLLEALSVGTPIVATDCATGPREILAPDLTPSEPIAYPYVTPYGTLTAPLAPEACYETLAAVPLTLAEQQHAEAMLAALGTSYDPDAFTTRTADFALGKTIDQWEGLLY